jgi:hypothetical protein
MKRLAAMAMTGLLSGCQLIPFAPACPAGQEHLRTAQLSLGRKNVGPPVKASDLQKFIDREITPRFPAGVTVMEGGSQWKGADSVLVRDAAKIVLIILPASGDRQGRLEAVRRAYRAQFKQESVLVVTQPACMAV